MRTLLEADAIPGFVRTMNDNDFDANIQQAASSAMLILAKHSYAVVEVSVGLAERSVLLTYMLVIVLGGGHTHAQEPLLQTCWSIMSSIV